MNPRWIEEMSWRMGEVYGAVVDRILINLARHFPYIAEGMTPGGSWDYQIRKLAELGQVTRETEAIILESMKGADAALADLLEETIRESIKKVEPDLRKAAEKGLLLGEGFLPPRPPRRCPPRRRCRRRSRGRWSPHGPSGWRGCRTGRV